MVEPIGWRAEVECGAGRLEVDLRNPQARAELETGRLEAADPSSRVEPPEEELAGLGREGG